MKHTSRHTLKAIPPFDFKKTLWFLEFFSPTKDEQELTDEQLSKALLHNGQPVVFEVSANAEAVEVSLHSDAAFNDTEAILDRIAFFLGLDDDLTPFYELAQKDPPMRPIIEHMYGYHAVKFPSPFENVVWALVSARNRIANARHIKNRLIDAAGARVTLRDTTFAAFPEPAGLLELPPAQLAELIGQERRADYVRGAAQAFLDVDEQWLRTGDYDAVRDWLLDIKGIGNWSAAFVLIRGLGRNERIDAPEKELIRAATNTYGRLFEEEDIQAKVGEYGPYAGYWAHYLRAAN